MKSCNLLRIYKRNVYNCKNLIFPCLISFLLIILLRYFFLCINEEVNISDIKLLSFYFSVDAIWFYVVLCIVIILQLLLFTEDYLHVIRLHKKDSIWKLVIQHILITNFIISLYVVIFNYIFALIFANKISMNFDKAIIIIPILILLFTIGLSIFSTLAFIVKIITRNKNIVYLILVAIVIKDLYSEGYSILNDISFRVEYIKNTGLAFLSIFRLGGGLILLFELGRFFYKREDIYNTKNKIMNGN